MRVQLRPYQTEALDRTLAAAERGVRRQLGVAATGLGKTVMFVALAERMGGRALVLAHRDELVAQAAAKVREVWPGANVGIVKAGSDEVHAHVVVASVQTLARESRLDRLLLACAGTAGDGAVSSLFGGGDPFGLVVVDEAHHAAADTYQRILGALRAGHDDGPLLLGVTATPDRGDGQGLDGTFDEIVWSYDLLWGIRSGFLSDVRGLRVTIDNLDLSGVRVTRGDYSAGDAGRALADAEAPLAIVRAWAEHAADRRTLVFTPTVATAAAVADQFKAAGVAAAWVSGETPMDERRATLAAYSRGDVQVLANCAVLTEGYDEPRTDCVVVARPTQSRALYAQMVGRGTRRHPDKTDCLVLDVVGATTEHSLQAIPSLFGLDEVHARQMHDGSALATGVVDHQERELVRLGVLRAAEVELFAAMRGAGIAWLRAYETGQPGLFVRPLTFRNDGPAVHLVQDPHDGSWSALALQGKGDPDPRVLIGAVAMELAQGVAEDYLRRRGAAAAVAADAPWRARPPSPKAVRYARRLGITVEPGWTAGEVSDAIDRARARPRR